jgi:uncharacterized membrane protein
VDERETIIFGIPVPSDNRLFLTIVVIHILLGIICVVAGIVGMLSTKGGRVHSLAGKTYYWFLGVLFATVIPLSIMRWPHNNHLFVLGVLSFLTASLGRRLTRIQKPGWTRQHTLLMGCSYIFLLTAFYVDNGKNLPFWNQFSQLFFWLFPAAIGIPIIVYALRRNPLNRRPPAGKSPATLKGLFKSTGAPVAHGAEDIS